MSVASMIAKANTTLTHERQDTTRTDASGARIGGWTAVASGVACWRQPAGARVQEHYARREMAVSHSIYVATALDCQENDRVVIGGTNYVVVGYLDASAGLGKAWRIDALERT